MKWSPAHKSFLRAIILCLFNILILMIRFFFFFFQISEVLNELQGIEFSLDLLEKQVGDEIIALLQQGRKFNGNDNNELESFHQAATKLGITSSRAALRERRALKKLVERARAEEDKRKESIVAFLLHLIRKYSKLFRSELSDDNDSQGSTPCSPTVQGSFEYGIGAGGNIHAFDRQLSKLSSFNFKPNFRRSDQMPVPPEELRCPISLQLMYNPVIIASGQTYERICIEKWFSDGHNTCPKTQQELPHLGLTPNYCVKGLVASWCEQNGVPIPDGPPESLDLNYWRLALSESESANSKSTGSIASCKFKGVKVVPLEDSGVIEEAEGNEVDESAQEDELQVNSLERYDDFLAILNEGEDFRKKCRVVEQIRHLLKDDEEIRIYMGANGFIEALVGFLECAVETRNEIAQEIGTMALFNLGVNNNRCVLLCFIMVVELQISFSQGPLAQEIKYLFCPAVKIIYAFLMNLLRWHRTIQITLNFFHWSTSLFPYLTTASFWRKSSSVFFFYSHITPDLIL